LAEEVQSAATVVPRAIVWGVLINGTLGWSMVIAMVFCMGSLPKAVNATTTMFYPFLEIFQQAVQSTVGACLMATVILVMGICSAVGGYASASRMLWSFARDRGVPLSKRLTKVRYSCP
jgi:choline transport protein